MAKQEEIKNTEYQTPPHQWTVDFLNDEFEKESDRACVILVASLIDDSLTNLLKGYLVPLPSSNDNLFENATAPLSTFSAKIDMAHRLALISGQLCRDIHLIRKIRNSFAHDVYGCNFDNGSVKSRVNELNKSLVFGKVDDSASMRIRFLWATQAILWSINTKANDSRCLKEASIEWLYLS